MNGNRVTTEKNRERNREVGERIRIARLGKGLSQEAFAHALGVSLRQAGRWEQGENPPKKQTLEQIAEHTGVSYAWLLVGGQGPHGLDVLGRVGGVRSAGLARLLESGRPIRDSTRRSLVAIDQADQTSESWTDQAWNDLASFLEANAATAESSGRVDLPASTTPVVKKPKPRR